MLNRLLTTCLAGLLLLACGGRADDASPCAPAELGDAGVVVDASPDTANIVDECVDTLHSEFACVQAQLPTVYTALECAGTPKLMHPEDGTLISRPDGRDGCISQTNYKGEHLTCCPACPVGKAPCTGGGCCAM
jgi:hypothetical protein